MLLTHIRVFSHFFCTKKHDFSEKATANAPKIGKIWEKPKKLFSLLGSKMAIFGPKKSDTFLDGGPDQRRGSRN
jgi:hypothetical protein